MNEYLEDAELSENLFKLSELFPDVSLKHILHILKISNDDFDSAVEQLLSYDIIKDELDQMDEEEAKAKAVNEEKPKEWVVANNQKETDYVKPKNKKGKQGKDKKNSKTVNHRRNSSTVINGSNTSNNARLKRRTSSTTSTDSTPLFELGTSNSALTSTNSLSNAMESLKIEELAKKLELEDEIMEILEIPEKHRDLMDWYLTQNSCKKLDTIYDIMLNFSPYETIENQPRDKIDNVSLNLLLSSEESRTGKAMSMSELIKHGIGCNNKIPAEDNSWNGLQLLINDNPELDLPQKFYLLAMNWYEKDLGKILHAGIILNNCFEKKPKMNNVVLDANELGFQSENNATGHDVFNIESGGFFKVEKTGHIDKSGFLCADEDDNMSSTSSMSQSLDSLKWRVDKLKSTRDTTNNKHLKSFYTHSIAETKNDIINHHEMTQHKELMRRIETAKKTFYIDCHALSVQNALYALGTCLTYWWDLEMHFRNVQNTRFEFTCVTHVDPFSIVTGRGLHSGGGVPKIKNATIRYLQENDYKFEDNMSTIRVLGKRRVFK